MNNALNIPRNLNAANIDEAINDYLELLNQIPVSINAGNVLELLSKIKRHKINNGPYPHVTLFEAANRIMTDLTILYGVKDLLNGRLKDLKFDQYKVEFGNENHNDHDIMASNESEELIGEAFNVAETFFQVKKTSSLRKLRKSGGQAKILLLMYNSDAVKDLYKPEILHNEYYLPVKIILPEKMQGLSYNMPSSANE